MAAVANLLQRAEQLVAAPNQQAIDQLNLELRQLDPNNAAVEEAFFLLVQAQQWLELHPAQPHLAGRVAQFDANNDIAPPADEAFVDQLIPNLPPQQVAPVVPAQQPQPAPAPVAAQPQPAVVAQPAPPQPNICMRMWTAFSNAMKTLYNYVASFLCCKPKEAVQPLVNPVPPANVPVPQPAPAPLPVIAAQPIVVPAPELNEVLAAQPVAIVAPQLLAQGQAQPIGQFQGTINIDDLGGIRAVPLCGSEFLVDLWRAVDRRENITAEHGQNLIDCSLRKGAAKLLNDQNQDFNALFPDIIDDVEIPDFNVDQNYMRELQKLDRYAFRNEKHLSAAAIINGQGRQEVFNIILIDERLQLAPRYYQFIPNGNGVPPVLKIFNQIRPLIASLTQEMPIEAQNPFLIKAFAVRELQAQVAE